MAGVGLPLLPLLSGRRALGAEEGQERLQAPYLKLQKFIEPGRDEFACEKEAAAIKAKLGEYFRSAVLPNELAGRSPCPREYRAISLEVKEGLFADGDRDVQEGWTRWVRFFKSVKRAQFDQLPGGLVRFEVAGEDTEGRLVHRTGHWHQRWEGGRLVEFEPVEDYLVTEAKPWFRDVTAAAFGGVASFRNQLARGVPYWRSRIDPATGMDLYGSNGVSVGDIDGDGQDEIYVCQPGGLPNRLYKFTPELELKDITDEWGAGILDDTSAALFLDLRNCGRQDLVVVRNSGPVLLVNEGGRFRLREDAFQFASRPAGNFTGAAAADFDRDGKLDLYLCCYVYFQSEAQYTYAVPYQDAQNGPPNFLFRNGLNPDGSGYFVDVTEETGMNQSNDRFSFAPAWCDFNDDGWPDLFVANDFGRKNLYVNEGGHFTDKTAEARVEDIGPGMSAAWFDADKDGLADLYVANMWTAAGQRVVADPHFAPSHAPGMANAYRRHTMGNSLYRNRGDGTFAETSREVHAAFGRWAWAAGGHDLDNDGEAEIFTTCGMLTNESTEDLSSFFWRQVVAKSPVVRRPSAAYENGWNAINQFIREDYSWNGREPNVLHVKRGDRYFDFSGVSGLDFAEDSRAFAVVDFDGDGRPDLILKSRLGPQVRVLQNQCAAERNSITFELRGTKSNRDAIGARVRVDEQTKWLEAGSGFLSQHSKRMIFGLGRETAARRVAVKWPSGTEEEFHDLAAGQTVVLTEGSSKVEKRPYEPGRLLPSNKVDADNTMRLEDTWFVDAIPLPEKQRGPGLLVLREAELSSERKEQYEIFRRYLFDWRTPAKFPLALLLDRNGDAAKIYASVPSTKQAQADLAVLASARERAMPFGGIYVGEPHRDFFKFGVAFLWAGYTEQALPYLEAVLRRTPDNARVLVLAGQIHLFNKRTAQAEECFKKAIESNGGNAEAWSGMGDVAEDRGDLAGALKNYEKAIELKADLLPTLLSAGRVEDKLGRSPAAEAFYRRALEMDGQSAEAANGLGLSLAKQGRDREAADYFKQAIATRRDYADAVNNLGVLYIKQSKTNDAIAAFEYGIRVAPNDDILYLNLGRTYAQMGDRERAKQVMRELLERKPDSATAQHALAELEAQ